MVWSKWDSDNVDENRSHSAINLHRQVDNVRDHSEARNRGYTLWYSDPLEVGSVGKARGHYFRAKVVPETGSLKISVTHEVFDAPMNVGFRLAGGSPNTSTALPVTNGRTVLETTLDITPAQQNGWDPRGVEVVLDMRSEPSSEGGLDTWQLHMGTNSTSFTNDMFLAVSPDPNLTIANPLAVRGVVSFLDGEVAEVPGATPTRQVIETVSLPGLTTWSADVFAGGTNYSPGEILSVDAGGSFDQVPMFIVGNVDGGNAVTSVTLLQEGTYIAAHPPNPVATTVATGPGAGCSLNLIYNEGGFRVWPPLSETRDFLVGDEVPANAIKTNLYGRIRIYSIHIEEIEQPGQYVTSGATDLFPIRDTYETKKALQSGYPLRNISHIVPYLSQESLWANRTAMHSAGPGPHGGSPSDSDYKSRLSVYPTQVWKEGDAGLKVLFGAYFNEGDHFFNAGVDLERASASISADVLFFAQEEGVFAATVSAAMYTAPNTLLGTSPPVPVEFDVKPIPRSPNAYAHNILNYYRDIGESASGSRNNLQGVFPHNPFRGDEWSGLVQIQIEMKIPDVTVAMQDYIQVLLNIDESSLSGVVKAVVLSWSVIETTGMAIDVLGRP